MFARRVVGTVLLGGCVGVDKGGGVDSGAGSTVVSVAREGVPFVEDVDLFLVDQVLQDTDPATLAPIGESWPSLVGLSVAPPMDLSFPRAVDADGCWVLPTYDEFFPAERGPVLTVSFDGVEVPMAWEDELYQALPEGPAAVAASTPGTAMSVEGTATGLSVPEMPVFVDLGTAFAALPSSGKLALEWAPSASATSQTYLRVDLRFSEGTQVGCALVDDGQATLDVGGVDGSVLLATLGRTEAAPVDHEELGTILVALSQDLLVMRD